MTELHELRWDPMLSVGWMTEARNQKLNPAGIQFYEDSTLQPLQNMATVNPRNSSSSAGTMEVSQNGGTSKSSISIGFSIINQQKNIHFAHFGVLYPMTMETPQDVQDDLHPWDPPLEPCRIPPGEFFGLRLALTCDWRWGQTLWDGFHLWNVGFSLLWFQYFEEVKKICDM